MTYFDDIGTYLDDIGAIVDGEFGWWTLNYFGGWSADLGPIAGRARDLT